MDMEICLGNHNRTIKASDHLHTLLPGSIKAVKANVPDASTISGRIDHGEADIEKCNDANVNA